MIKELKERIKRYLKGARHRENEMDRKQKKEHQNFNKKINKNL